MAFFLNIKWWEDQVVGLVVSYSCSDTRGFTSQKPERYCTCAYNCNCILTLQYWNGGRNSYGSTISLDELYKEFYS